MQKQSRERADQALADVLDMFESSNLPEAIATSVIHRLESDAPSAEWSLGNQILMLLAGTADARGYKQWQAVGRHVVKGSKAFYILAPRTRKITETDPDSGEETSKVVTIGFVGVPVFRLEDTEGEPVEYPDYQPAELPPLFEIAERLGVNVRWLPFSDRFLGYYQPGRGEIVLCSHDVRVFFHELAHAAHDRISKLKGGQVASQEIVAETVAATLSRLYGFDGYLAASREYVWGYAQSQTNPARAVMKVIAEVEAVLDLILQPGEVREQVAA